MNDSFPQATYTAKVSDLLSFLRLHADLSAGRFDGLDEPTVAAVTGLGEALLGSEGESKEAGVRGFLSGDGQFQDVTCSCDVSVVFTSAVLTLSSARCKDIGDRTVVCQSSS
jgi:hypothetical protein